MAKDVKVIPSEECVPQHKLFICEIQLKTLKHQPNPFIPKLRHWRLNDVTVQEDFERVFSEKVNTNVEENTEDIWKLLKSALLTSTGEICGITKKRHRKRETWWWNDNVSAAIAEKRRCWKIWKQNGNKEEYLQAKRNAKRSVYIAKKTAEENKFADLKPGMNDIFKIAKQMRNDNQDIIGDKCVKDDSGNLSIDIEAKKAAWKQHYERLLNEEFPWNSNNLAAYSVAGPPILITVDMVLKAIAKMKPGKAAGPSGVVAEMLKAAGHAGARLVADLANSMIRNGDMPSDWERSFIINLYKGKGDALERGNYRGLKLLDHVMKAMERVMETIIRDRIFINNMQFGFMPGRGTTDAIFILRQLQEKYLSKNKKLYFAFVDLEKAFDRVPRKVIWWAMRKLGIEEWIVQFVQAMYHITKSRVRVDNNFTDEFGVKVGVHQGSVLSPLLFIIVLEALSREFRTGTPWELLYADDLVIIAETEEELRLKLTKWKTEMEEKGLRINLGKTKIMASGTNLHTLKDSGKYPCSVCRKGVGNNSIYCSGCSHWVHKKCCGIAGPLKNNPEYRCSRCRSVARPIDGRPHTKWTLNGDSELDMVDQFCYLGDTIGAGGGCELSIITRIRSAWGKFRELLPLLTSRVLSFKTRGRIYATYIRPVLLYASECWAPTIENMQKLQRNERAMIRWTCNVRLKDHISSVSLLEKLGIDDIKSAVRYNRLRWYGHVYRNEGSIRQAADMVVDGSRGRGRPKKNWTDTVKEDSKAWKMTCVDPMDRVLWRKNLKKKIIKIYHIAVQPP
jgi:hypothetical protein